MAPSLRHCAARCCSRTLPQEATPPCECQPSASTSTAGRVGWAGWWAFRCWSGSAVGWSFRCCRSRTGSFGRCVQATRRGAGAGLGGPGRAGAAACGRDRRGQGRERRGPAAGRGAEAQLAGPGPARAGAGAGAGAGGRQRTEDARRPGGADLCPKPVPGRCGGAVSAVSAVSAVGAVGAATGPGAATLGSGTTFSGGRTSRTTRAAKTSRARCCGWRRRPPGVWCWPG